jgi:hypothetical protein
MATNTRETAIMTTSDKPQLKNRIEEVSSSMSPKQESAIRILAVIVKQK